MQLHAAERFGIAHLQAFFLFSLFRHTGGSIAHARSHTFSIFWIKL
jgi:hypothetical protein